MKIFILVFFLQLFGINFTNLSFLEPNVISATSQGTPQGEQDIFQYIESLKEIYSSNEADSNKHKSNEESDIKEADTLQTQEAISEKKSLPQKEYNISTDEESSNLEQNTQDKLQYSDDAINNANVLQYTHKDSSVHSLFLEHLLEKYSDHFQEYGTNVEQQNNVDQPSSKDNFTEHFIQNFSDKQDLHDGYVLDEEYTINSKENTDRVKNTPIKKQYIEDQEYNHDLLTDHLLERYIDSVQDDEGDKKITKSDNSTQKFPENKNVKITNNKKTNSDKNMKDDAHYHQLNKDHSKNDVREHSTKNKQQHDKNSSHYNTKSHNSSDTDVTSSKTHTSNTSKKSATNNSPPPKSFKTKEFNNFIENELKMLYINQDIVLGKITENYKLSIMDYNQYIKQFWEKYEYIQNTSKRNAINRFIENYHRSKN